jgi:hypothetical protein
MANQQIFYINSRSRLSGTDNDFFYQINTDSNLDLNRVAILDISIPKTYFNLQNGYNYFTVLEYDITAPRLITIPPANYSKNTLKAVLTSLLNTGAPAGLVYSINIDSNTVGDTGRYYFIVSGNSDQPSFVFDENGPWEQMGFASGTFQFSGNALTSPNVMNLNSENIIYLHSDICQGDDNILQHIYTTSQPSYSYILWDNPDVQRYSKPLTNKFSNIFHFYILNEENIALDLQGNNMVFAILLFHYDDANEMIKKYIKYKMLTE